MSRLALTALLVVGAGLWSAGHADLEAARRPGRATPPRAAARAIFDAAAWTGVPLGRLDPRVLDAALRAAACAVESGVAALPSTLTVIDYSRPSTEPRLWVFDLGTRELLFQELVAHGVGSGVLKATSFSNEPESRQTSLGLFATAETYMGRNGYSLRLDGLEPGINDQARARAIVMHGAPYVNASMAAATGRLGRSWGCPAVRPQVTRALLDRIRGGGLLFAYHPSPDWLGSSPFLNGCSA